MRKRIGECLRSAGVLTAEALERALEEQKRSGERLGAILLRAKLASERQIAKALAFQLGLEYADLVQHPPDPVAVAMIPKDVALKRTCIAVAVQKKLLTVAMSDPLDLSLVQDLEFQTGYRVKQVVAPSGEIVAAIGTSYLHTEVARLNPMRGQPDGRAADSSSRPATGQSDTADIARRPEVDVFERSTAPDVETSGTAPIVDMVDLIVKSALKSRASDIHIEPGDQHAIVRHRLDGLLKEVTDYPKWMHDGLVARIKIMAGLDIAEKRLPQDGRIHVTTAEGHEIDLRVSTLRTIFGEKIVLRLLDHRKGVPPLEELGLSAPALEQLRFFLRHQHGMVLVVGPTGSGKTTTLSSALASIRSERSNIVTIEDPVEYQIPGVNQTQINTKINLTFAGALRSILRQDPDVVLVGEIRDHETARIAMQAAQTGHLVLSTLHTDDAPSCVTRLTDIGIEPYVTASALIGVVAQRLVRRLCADCRRPYTPEAETLRAMGLSEDDRRPVTFYRAAGCERCKRIGYRGRVGIYEIMAVTDDLRRLIAQRGSETQLRDAAVGSGMLSLGEDGLLKVKAGLTTPQELLRVVTEVRHTRGRCGSCGTRLLADFTACPICGQRVRATCSYCSRPVQHEWRYCPYCAKPSATSGRGRSATDAASGEIVSEPQSSSSGVEC